MSDRVEYIRRRLDQLEAHAEKDLWAADRATAGEWVALYGHNMPSAIEADGVRIADVASDTDVLLMARFKPETVRRRAKAVLARVEADRAILDVHDAKLVEVINADGDERSGLWCTECDYEAYPCPTVRLMAEGLGWKGGGDE